MMEEFIFPVRWKDNSPSLKYSEKHEHSVVLLIFFLSGLPRHPLFKAEHAAEIAFFAVIVLLAYLGSCGSGCLALKNFTAWKPHLLIEKWMFAK